LQGEKLAKLLTCDKCNAVVDRDQNAAKNLRDWPDYANPGPVGASALFEPGPPSGTASGTDGRSDVRVTGHLARRRRTNLVLAAVGEARTKADVRQQRNPARGVSS